MSVGVPSQVETGRSIRIRPYVPADQPFALSLAPRLVIGIPPWRDQAKMLATVEQWLAHSLAGNGTETMVLVAEDVDGERLGFATVSHSSHFTGVRQAEIGELAVHEAATRLGVGRALVLACEQWARDQGYRFLALGTGAANHPARAFYHQLGFFEEDVRLVKLLDVQEAA